MSQRVTSQIGPHQLAIETGRFAQQADGSVTVQLGETIVLVAAVAASKARPGQDFFPLTVDYREKAASAGRFPGGYFKREGRPTEKEILTCRLTDRPIRPLFPKGWLNEVQIHSLVLSADGENEPDVLSILGASVALMISDIPWDGPLGAVRVGRVNGEFVAFPTHAQMKESDIDLVYVGNRDEVVMIEGSANEISDETFEAALLFGQECCRKLIESQEELTSIAGKQKREITVNKVDDEVLQAAKEIAGDRVTSALLIPAKLKRESECDALADEVASALKERFGEETITDQVAKEAFQYIQKETVRNLMLQEDKRLDGRSFDEVRSISSETGMLPRVHGSASFRRGETQALSLATLGTPEEAQEFDSYTGGDREKKFILHYNFPNFSVGETGRISGPGRREIGHGALAERSIRSVLPIEEYPYAVRISTEILESNGSTSMATVCASSLALMDAGIPLKRPVAGISVGLCSDSQDGKISNYRLLTDIIGWEDAFGDMDFKIAGTANGITGFQLDLKLPGLPHQIMKEAIAKAHQARLSILESMSQALAEPRAELSRYAPRIVTIKINPDKIGALIGPGGKNIKSLVERSGCEINIEDDGSVKIYSVNEEGMRIAREAIDSMTAEIEVGRIYRGKVVTVKEFGCFVEVFPGKDGLVHISELANFRVKNAEDIVKVGDEIWVKCIGVDEKDRVRLSRKAAMAERDEETQQAKGQGSEPQLEQGNGNKGAEQGEPEKGQGREGQGRERKGPKPHPKGPKPGSGGRPGPGKQAQSRKG